MSGPRLLHLLLRLLLLLMYLLARLGNLMHHLLRLLLLLLLLLVRVDKRLVVEVEHDASARRLLGRGALRHAVHPQCLAIDLQ